MSATTRSTPTPTRSSPQSVLRNQKMASNRSSPLRSSSIDSTQGAGGSGLIQEVDMFLSSMSSQLSALESRHRGHSLWLKAVCGNGSMSDAEESGASEDESVARTSMDSMSTSESHGRGARRT